MKKGGGGGGGVIIEQLKALKGINARIADCLSFSFLFKKKVLKSTSGIRCPRKTSLSKNLHQDIG